MSYHVRDLLESVQEPAPTPRTTTDDIIAAAGRIRAQRRAATVAGSAVACLAVVAATAVTVGTPAADVAPSAAGPPAAGAAPVEPVLTLPEGFRTVLGEYRAGPYRVGPVGQVTAGYQELPVYRTGRTWRGHDGTTYPLSVGTVTVYRPGVYDPARLGTGGPVGTVGPEYPVTVAGRPGVGRDVIGVTSSAGPASAAPDGPRGAVLAWQYAPGAWATYVPRQTDQAQTRDDALRIAAGLTAGPERELRVPYRMNALPAGWETVAVTETPAAVSPTVSEVLLHPGPLPESARADRVDIRLEGVAVTVAKGQPADPDLRGQDGVYCKLSRSTCTMVRGEHVIELRRSTADLPDQDFRKIAEALHPVDIADPDAWLPVTG